MIRVCASSDCYFTSDLIRHDIDRSLIRLEDAFGYANTCDLTMSSYKHPNLHSL